MEYRVKELESHVLLYIINKFLIIWKIALALFVASKNSSSRKIKLIQTCDAKGTRSVSRNILNK